MNEPQTLLAVFAHPDDESLLIGGTLARLAAEGWRTALLCATRGEWGPISDEALADYSNLAAVREQELRAACRVLGVSHLAFLDLEDASLATLDEQEQAQVVARIAQAIKELQPTTLITFGPDGLYGHADHIAIGRLTTDAHRLVSAAKAQPRAPRLFYTTAPHDYYARLLARVGAPAHVWNIPPEQFGIPAEQITATADITPFLARKLAALACHRTQLDAAHVFSLLTPELAIECFAQEFFVAAE